MPFKIGAVKMAHDSKCFLVPFTITGKYKVFRRSITLTFYEPYKTQSDDLTEGNKKLEKLISDKLNRNR